LLPLNAFPQGFLRLGDSKNYRGTLQRAHLFYLAKPDFETGGSIYLGASKGRFASLTASLAWRLFADWNRVKGLLERNFETVRGWLHLEVPND
jgi:hypothetical protein